MGHTKLFNPEQLHIPAHTASAPVKARLSSGTGNRDLLSQLGGSKAMPEPVQARMEEALGADFSGVHLYESPIVAQGGAQAAAAGNAVAFAPGKLSFSSRSGLELLGHELSHVASQARGEVSGSGFVNDSTLEHRADADGTRAAGAFDSLSGQTLTPMSAGMSMPSVSAPVQAKKGQPKSRGDVLLEDFNSRDASGQVELMLDMWRYQAYSRDTDNSEMEAYFSLLQQTTPEFMDAMYQKQLEASQNLDAYNTNLIAMGTPEQEALFQSKYSAAGDRLASFGEMLREIGVRGDPEGGPELVLSYAQKSAAEAPEILNQMKYVQNNIIQLNEKTHPWALANPEAADRHRDTAEERNALFAQNWNNQRNNRVAEANQRRGFFSRLFRRH